MANLRYKFKPLPSYEWLNERFEYRDGYIYKKEKPLEHFTYVNKARKSGKTYFHRQHFNKYNENARNRKLLNNVTDLGVLRGTLPGWEQPKQQILAARIIWILCTKEQPRGKIVNIDGDPLNNRIENLRDDPI